MNVLKICEKKGLNWNYRCDRNPERNHTKDRKEEGLFLYPGKREPEDFKRRYRRLLCWQGIQKKIKGRRNVQQENKKQRGRLETREYYYTEETEWLIRNKEWKEVKGIGASILTTEENGKK